MTDSFVATEVTKERMQRLTALVEQDALTHHEARVGRVERVLVEGPSKTDSTRLSGRTRQQKLVHFTPDHDGHAAAGGVADVRITRAAPHWLAGELVSVVDEPRRAPVRIPVTAG